jgi:4-hydroxy 2-oxovalerate aldolase
MISGANSLPQKDVMNWVTARFYSFNSIIRALQNQKIGIEDNQKLKLFKPQNEFSKAVIIGGGPNANIHSTAVKEFIQRESDICVIHASSKNASNYKDLNLQQYFCLVGNEGHRLEKIFDDLGTFDGYCVLPPFPRKMGTYIPQAVKNKCFELASVEFIEKLNDTHTVIALQTAISLGVKNVFLVGYDGYNSSVISNMEQQLFSENELIFSKARKVLDIVSLVPTQYSIPITSVYSLLFR